MLSLEHARNLLGDFDLTDEDLNHIRRTREYALGVALARVGRSSPMYVKADDLLCNFCQLVASSNCAGPVTVEWSLTVREAYAALLLGWADKGRDSTGVNSKEKVTERTEQVESLGDVHKELGRLHQMLVESMSPDEKADSPPEGFNPKVN
jgi:hypothetical protein